MKVSRDMYVSEALRRLLISFIVNYSCSLFIGSFYAQAYKKDARDFTLAL